MQKLIVLSLTLFSAFASSSAQQSLPSQQIDEQAHALLLRFTLDQKLSLLGGEDRKFIHGIPELQLPKVRMSDGPLGVSVTVIGTRVLLPSNNYAAGIALAASWDPSLARQIGEQLGEDARARDVGILLGPAVNLIRAPMDGRAFEYFGEDPWLTSQLAVNYIEGVQSKGVIATVKHFVANNSEFDRNHTNSIIDEQTLHELYLPAFERSIKEAGVGAVMDSYNLLNGTHLTQHCAMNVDLLRKNWNFTGILMSDWDATYDGVQAAKCGLDLEMPFAKFMTKETLHTALQQGDLDIETIDQKVMNILRTEIRFGLLNTSHQEPAAVYTTSSRALALQSALESIVLLKNESNMLPLSRVQTHTITVIGPDAYPAVPGGGGSSHVASFAPVSLLTGIVDTAGKGTRILYQRGLPSPEDIFATTRFDAPLELAAFNSAAYDDTPIRAEHVEHIADWHLDVWTPPLKPRYLRWTGTFTPVADGRYLLLAAALNRDTYEVRIDGRTVIMQPAAEGQAPRTAILELAAHKAIHLDIRYVSTNTTPRMGFGIRAIDDLINHDAIAAAIAADAVVLAVGFDPTTESEGYDRTFQLPWGQDELIQAISAVNKHVIVTLTAGGAVDTHTWIDSVQAFLHNWYPGQEGGHAVAQILFGDVSPSGHLPVSFEKTWQQNPVHDFYYPQKGSDDVHYGEGLFLGYRYYTSSNIKPLFPFGFGLTYTSFHMKDLQIETPRIADGNTIVSFEIENTGQQEGTEVCQLYIGLDQPGTKRPAKELQGFERVTLKPQEIRRIRMELTPRQLSYYDVATHNWQRTAGATHIYVGDSSENTPLQGILPQR